MSRHASIIHVTTGPDDPHAFSCIPQAQRTGDLDEKCPTCKGHGQWNKEIDLVSFRSKRTICDHCVGSGWIETGDDARAVPDIIMTPEGYPKWILRYLPCR
jgi:hypothetical protein